MNGLGMQDEALGTLLCLGLAAFGLVGMICLGEVSLKTVALTGGYNEIQMNNGCGKMWQKAKEPGDFGNLFRENN